MLGLSRTPYWKDMDPGYKYAKWFVQRTTPLGPIGISLSVCWAQNSLISDKKLTSKSLRIHEQKIPLRMVPLIWERIFGPHLGWSDIFHKLIHIWIFWSSDIGFDPKVTFHLNSVIIKRFESQTRPLQKLFVTKTHNQRNLKPFLCVPLSSLGLIVDPGDLNALVPGYSFSFTTMF